MKIAISSGKGGTGKTTLSTNLAHFLAQKKPVTLVDLDVEEPNSGLFIKGKLKNKEEKFKDIPQWQETKCKPCNICHDVCNYNAVIRLGEQIMVFDELCHSCYACVELCPEDALIMKPQRIGELRHYEMNNLHFIDAILDIGREQAVPLISQTIEYVDKNIDNTQLKLYDTPPGTSCPVIEATKNVDLVILITEPTPFGLNDLKLSVEAMEKLGKDFVIVLNRHGIGNNDTEEFCKSKNIRVIARIPNDREVAKLYSNGELIYNKIPEFARELEKIEESIERLSK